MTLMAWLERDSPVIFLFNGNQKNDCRSLFGWIVVRKCKSEEEGIYKSMEVEKWILHTKGEDRIQSLPGQVKSSPADRKWETERRQFLTQIV